MTSIDNSSGRHPARARFTVAVAASTFVLVWIGGLVTSKNAGMAVPDWPNSYGYNMFFFPPARWVGGILFEHTHRLAASAVGFLTLILAAWLHGRAARPWLRWGGIILLIGGVASSWTFPERRGDNVLSGALGIAALAASMVWPNCAPAPRSLRRLGLIALGAVILQGVLGGLRVIQINDKIGILHAALAQLFFLLMSSLALIQTDFWRNLPAPPLPRARRAARIFAGVTCLVFAQLLIGATMRHAHAGLAIPDFPTAYGKLWPDTSPAAVARYNETRLDASGNHAITVAQIDLQMIHRLMALAILATVSWTAWTMFKEWDAGHPLRRVAAVWIYVVAAQVCLGMATIWTGKRADVATAHLACGALCLVTGGLGAVIAGRLAAGRRDLPEA